MNILEHTTLHAISIIYLDKILRREVGESNGMHILKTVILTAKLSSGEVVAIYTESSRA